MTRCQNAQMHCFFAAYTRSACCQPSTSYRSVGPSIRITLYTAAAMIGICMRRDPIAVACGAIVCVALIAAAGARPDQPVSDSVGVIDGEAIAVTGPMSMEVVNGQVKTVLHNGSDVRVKSGNAHVAAVVQDGF